MLDEREYMIIDVVVVVDQLREEDVRLKHLQHSYTTLTPLETSADSGAISAQLRYCSKGIVHIKICGIRMAVAVCAN